MQTVGQLTLFCALLIHFNGCDGQTPGRTGDGGLRENSQQCSTDNTLPLASLTEEEKGSLCDCVSAIGGGYAQSKPCGDGGDYVSTKESQSAITGAEALVRGAATPEQQAEARRALALAQSSQGTVELRAKFNGIVATRSVSEGELVGENGELFMLVDLATLVFVADVPLASLPSIHPGQVAAVRFAALPDRAFRGAVEAASPQSDPQSQTVKVRLRFSSGGGQFVLKTDMMGSAAIVTGVHRRALIVPRSAILRDDENNTSSVVTVGADSLARSVQVTVGATTDSTAEITGGALKEGMTVVTEGNYALADSTRVTAAP